MARSASVALAVGLALGLGAATPTSSAGPKAEPPVPPTAGVPPPTTTRRGTPLSTTPPPTAGYPGGPPRSPTDQVKARTLTGTVATAAGCLVLDTGAGRWALVGDAPPANLVAGTRVEVTARPLLEAESPCGSPVLSVLTLTRL
jgi:hypothetical protein